MRAQSATYWIYLGPGFQLAALIVLLTYKLRCQATTLQLTSCSDISGPACTSEDMGLLTTKLRECSSLGRMSANICTMDNSSGKDSGGHSTDEWRPELARSRLLTTAPPSLKRGCRPNSFLCFTYWCAICSRHCMISVHQLGKSTKRLEMSKPGSYLHHALWATAFIITCIMRSYQAGLSNLAARSRISTLMLAQGRFSSTAAPAPGGSN